MNFLNWLACHVLKSHSPHNYETVHETGIVVEKTTKGCMKSFRGECRFCGKIIFANYIFDLTRSDYGFPDCK
jgi:hypothetical protein